MSARVAPTDLRSEFGRIGGALESCSPPSSHREQELAWPRPS